MTLTQTEEIDCRQEGLAMSDNDLGDGIVLSGAGEARAAE
jgi:hypothetical protein